MFCSVIDCFNSTEDGFVMKFLPKDRDFLNDWLKYVKLRPLILSQNNPICEYHYNKNKDNNDNVVDAANDKNNLESPSNITISLENIKTPFSGQYETKNTENSDVCRLCGTKNNISMRNLFTQEFTSSVEFHEFISSYLEIQILKTDLLPKTICYGCIRRINNIIIYKEKCLKANAILAELHAIEIQKEINRDNYFQLSEEEYDVEYLDENFEGALYDEITINDIITDNSNLNVDDIITQNEDIIYDGSNTITTDGTASRSTNDDEVLEKEINIHTGNVQTENTNKKYKCSLCRKYFDTNVEKFQHYRLCKLEADAEALRKPQYKCRETKSCPICGRKVIDLRIHMAYHSEKRKFACHQCSNTFYTLSSLKSHLEIHNEKTLKCPECNEYFPGKDHLRRHRRRHNEAAKKHLCEFCSKKFLKPVELRVHIGIVHKGEKAFKCDQCSEGFNYRHSLNRHAEKVHNTNIKGDRTNRISKFYCDL